MSKLLKHSVRILGIILMISCIINAQLPGGYTRFNINNISTYIYNNGFADLTPAQNPGLSFPKGRNQYIVFASGVVWGGKVNKQVRVGGSVYRSGLQPGRVLKNGKADNLESESVRPFRVRPDYKTSNLLSEINEGEGTREEIFLQYSKDWQEWPAENGAPYNDINNNGVYDPAVDIPGMPGAAQTIWYVANDIDSSLTRYLYGSLTIGIEVQVTVWGYSGYEKIDNMVFKKYKFINKSDNDIKDMYISIWSDFEIGDSENDYTGCDTLLNLGYMYNKENTDMYLITSPPAIGNCLLQGPVVPGNLNDIAYFNWKQISGKKNLPMTSVHYLYPYKSSRELSFFEPWEGDYKRGGLLYYNFMQGRIADSTFHPIPVEFGGGITRYPLSGNPITGNGFLDGVQQSRGDRSVGIGSGPFELTVGDVQEIIFAEIAASGNNNINSVEVLKEYSKTAYDFYKGKIITAIPYSKPFLPNKIELYQNYPNPFNPVTKIKYSIPKSSQVIIKVYNVLGKETTTLVNQFKNAGEYEINFEGTNLPSGIYFYSLMSGASYKVRKMILLK